MALLFYCAPGRAHLLGGASPLYTRQGEVLAGRQVSEDSEVSIARCWLKEAAGRYANEERLRNAGLTNRNHI